MINRLQWNLDHQHSLLEALRFAFMAWLLVLLTSLLVAAPAVIHFSGLFQATGSQPLFYGVVATHALCANFSLITSVLAARSRERRWMPVIVLIALIGIGLSSCYGSPAAVLAPTLICLMPVRKGI